MIRTIVRANSIEVLDEDIIRARNWWRQQTTREYDHPADGTHVPYTFPCPLNDNGNRSFAEWMFELYEAASEQVDEGTNIPNATNMGALYWSDKLNAWVTTATLDQTPPHEPAFGPMTYLYHGRDTHAESEAEDAFYEGAYLKA